MLIFGFLISVVASTVVLTMPLWRREYTTKPEIPVPRGTLLKINEHYHSTPQTAQQILDTFDKNKEDQKLAHDTLEQSISRTRRFTRWSIVPKINRPKKDK